MDFSVINEIILALILGAVQGVTEFLPVSSTAHIRLGSFIITNGRDIGLAATNLLQFGTIFAVVTYFWKDLKVYFHRGIKILLDYNEAGVFLKNFRFWWSYPTAEELLKKPDLDKQLQEAEKDSQLQIDMVMSQLIVGTIPIGVLGLLLYNFASSNRDLNVIASLLIAGSILMGVGEWANIKAKKFNKTRILSRGEVILIGLFQVLSIFPGMSRSGSTISGALFLGRDRKFSVRFSFLLSVPAILLAGMLDLGRLVIKLFNDGITILPMESNWTSTEIMLSVSTIVIGFIVSYLIGFICLKWLIGYLSKNTFKWFIIYRVLIAVTILVLTFFRIIN